MCSAARRRNAPHVEELPDRENPALTLTEKPGASFNSSPDHMSESVRRGTQTVDTTKPTKVGYVFQVDFETEGSKGEAKLNYCSTFNLLSHEIVHFVK